LGYRDVRGGPDRCSRGLTHPPLVALTRAGLVVCAGHVCSASLEEAVAYAPAATSAHQAHPTRRHQNVCGCYGYHKRSIELSGLRSAFVHNVLSRQTGADASQAGPDRGQ